MSFAKKILSLRKSKGLDQIKVAKELGVTRQSMYKWESGACMPELDKIKKLAEIYGVTYDYLLNDNVDFEKEDIQNEKTVSFEQNPMSENVNNHKNNRKNKRLIIIYAISLLTALIIFTAAMIIILTPTPDAPQSNDKTTEIQIIPHTPDHELVVAQVREEATCESKGYTLMQCKEVNCNYWEIVTIMPLGHCIDEDTECLRCDYIKGSDGIAYEIYDGDKYYVKSIGKCTDVDIVIANVYNGKEVIGISEEAFMNNTNIASVKIPSSIESIGDKAFLGCSNLNSVEFGDNLKTIGCSAFERCALTEVTLPDKIEKIEKRAFYDNKIERLYIGKNANYIGEIAFYENPDFYLVYSGNKSWTVIRYGYYYGKGPLHTHYLDLGYGYVLKVED